MIGLRKTIQLKLSQKRVLTKHVKQGLIKSTRVCLNDLEVPTLISPIKEPTSLEDISSDEDFDKGNEQPRWPRKRALKTLKSKEFISSSEEEEETIPVKQSTVDSSSDTEEETIIIGAKWDGEEVTEDDVSEECKETQDDKCEFMEVDMHEECKETQANKCEATKEVHYY